MNSIGIVGGVGPTATMFFYERLLAQVARQAEGRLPHVLLYSLPIDPVLEGAFIAGDAALGRAAQQQMKELLRQAVACLRGEQLGTVVMPCNTLQGLLREVCDELSVTNIDLLSAVAARVRTAGMKKVLVVGTQTTCEKDIYGPPFAAHGIGVEYLPASDQERLALHILHMARARGGSPYLESCSEAILQAGHQVDGIVVGCTDLFAQLDPKRFDQPIIESLEVLVEATTAYILAG